MLAYSRMGRTSVVYARCLVLRGHVRMFLWRKADVVFALCAVLLMWVFQFRVLLMLARGLTLTPNKRDNGSPPVKHKNTNKYYVMINIYVCIL